MSRMDRTQVARGSGALAAAALPPALPPALCLCLCRTDGDVAWLALQDAHRQRTINWCDKTGGTAAAFDFTTKGILQEAVGRKEYWRLIDTQGRPPGMVGLWPSRAITFIENHDTGSTLQHWPFPWQNAQEGYAYILVSRPASALPCLCLCGEAVGVRCLMDRLGCQRRILALEHAARGGFCCLEYLVLCQRLLPVGCPAALAPAPRVMAPIVPLPQTHPGTPCVFWDHYEHDANIRKAIVELIKVRKNYKLNNRTKVKILAATADVYTALLDDKVICKIGPGDWSPTRVSHALPRTLPGMALRAAIPSRAAASAGSDSTARPTQQANLGTDFQLVCSGHQFAVWGKKL